MNWASFKPSECHRYHVDAEGNPAYNNRFDEVLKFHAPGLAPVMQAGLAWHIHADGTPAYNQRFQRTFGFYHNLAAVISDEGWHHINTSGESPYRDRYSWCGNFQSNVCSVRTASHDYFHIDATGRPLYEERWVYAGDYRDDVAVVQARDGRSTHIDKQGRLLHQRWFKDLDVFHKGFARARDKGGWTHINEAGEVIYTSRFAAVEPFYNGQARVERFDGGLEIIDEKGQTLIELRAANRSDFGSLSSDMVGFWKTRTIAAAVEFCIPESLPGTVTEAARRTSLPEPGARRLLRAMAELKLVDCDVEGVWQLTSKGQFLCRDHPTSLATAALEYAGPMSDLWDHLTPALKNPDWRAQDIFGTVANDATRISSHHQMLRSYARHDYGEVADVLDLDDVEVLVDAGGGIGVLSSRIAARWPQTQVVLMELPQVAELARDSLPVEVSLHAANLFIPWRIQADAVLLARVLHDWDDDKALSILRHARACLQAGGMLYLVEMLVPEHRVAGALCDLHLLVVTGGQERTLTAYHSLLHAAGFTPTEVRHVPSIVSVICAVAA